MDDAATADDGRIRGSVTTLETSVRWWVTRSVDMLGLPVSEQAIEEIADKVLEEANATIARELIVFGHSLRPWLRDAA